jgi:hypothetical protein
MTSLSLLHGEPYANMRTLLTHILVGALFMLFLVWARVLIGHLLCCDEGSVGFTYSLEVTVCLYEAHEVDSNVVNYFYIICDRL